MLVISAFSLTKVGKKTRAFQGMKAHGILGPKQQREICQAGLSKRGK